MSTKHDTLTEADMQRFRMNPAPLARLRAHAGSRAPGPARILDWGCGRGRAVLRNGHDLFRARGLDPERLLRPLDDIRTFGDGTFDIVFSEETIEHVADLAQVARESFRLLRPGGLAVHSFPGSRWLVEPHVHMPPVYWLASGKSRRLLIRAWLLFGFGPRPPWPEAGEDLDRQIDVYDRYLAEKTAYRPREEVMAAFTRAGFLGRWFGDASATGWRRLLPAALRDNGFPARHLLLHLVKPA